MKTFPKECYCLHFQTIIIDFISKHMLINTKDRDVTGSKMIILLPWEQNNGGQKSAVLRLLMR